MAGFQLTDITEKLRLIANGFEREKVTNAQAKSAVPVMRDAAAALRDLVRERDALKAENDAIQQQVDALQQRVHLCMGYDALQAENERLRDALLNIEEFWNRDQNETAMIGACWHAVETAAAALAAAEEGR